MRARSYATIANVAEPLTRMRFNLDFMPSPVPDRPGLVIRDSYRYSDVTLIVPPALVRCLECFDGNRTELDLRAMLVRTTGELDVSDLARNLVDTLSRSGFLEDEVFAGLKAGRQEAFAASPVREAAHAGSAYPDQPDDLRAAMEVYLGAPETSSSDGIIGIAAPHVSPEGGWKTYREAYRRLGPQYRDRTFVILGTSHYGDPERFGLTRKSFVTPFGSTPVDQKLANELAAEPAVKMEDYCHAVEHSIEFQVLFLQSIYGPDIRILPILCGSYARSIYAGGMPEDDEG
ncbi:MAG: AmmeMemoRadiSam system protein B, partial [Acidobacteriota bacterium]|nr:AmmeMemoRadiSam system protein B [Acidobacteriota bacterium]